MLPEFTTDFRSFAIAAVTKLKKNRRDFFGGVESERESEKLGLRFEKQKQRKEKDLRPKVK